MAEPDLLTRILQASAQSAPAPLFPAEYAAIAGLPRTDVDDAVDRLRLNGYLQIVDWVQGKGQGYARTPAGSAALETPTELRKPAYVAPSPEQPTLNDFRWRRGEAARMALIEPVRPTVTMMLLFGNFALFAVGMVIGLGRGVPFEDYLFANRSLAFSELMDTLGAVNSYRVIAEDQWWRLGSYQFLHAGITHLAMNMLSLYMLGPLLEGLWGSRRFLYLYLGAGLIGGAAVVMNSRGAVGASGAISGMLTSVGVWLWLNRDCLPEQVTGHMASRVGTSLLIMVLISTVPNVSWEGHLGGALGGALLSVPLYYQRFGQTWQRAVSWLALIAIPLVGIAAAYAMQEPLRTELIRERQRQVARRCIDTENYLFQTHNKFIVPLLAKGPINWHDNPDFVQEYRQACDEAVAKVQPLLDELAGLAREDKVHAQELEQINRYFNAWHELFDSQRRLFKDPAHWNVAEYLALIERQKQLLELRRPLEANSFMPYFSPLVKPEEQPDAPKRPADVG